MSQKIFDNDSVVICKIKITLTLKKSANLMICILNLSKVLMNEFYYDYIKNKYGKNSRLLVTDSDSLTYAIKTENVYEGFSKYKEMFDFNNYATESKYYDNSNKVLAGKMKDEITGAAVKEMFRLKPETYSFSVEDSIEHRKAKGINKNVVATISHDEYKDLLLNNKCLRYSINRIQNKNLKIGTYEINQIYLSCFDDKI